MRVYNTFNWAANDDKTVETVLQKFEAYCKPKTNVTCNRYLFLSRKQKDDEHIDDYAVVLKNLSSGCKYEMLRDSMTQYALILGMRDHRVRECLLKEQDLSLDKAINIARAIEQAQTHAKTLYSEGTADMVMKV